MDLPENNSLMHWKYSCCMFIKHVFGHIMRLTIYLKSINKILNISQISLFSDQFCVCIWTNYKVSLYCQTHILVISIIFTI